MPMIFIGAMAVLGAPGCFFESTSDPGPAPVVGSGRLVMRWTVDEGVDPNVCAMGGATTFDLVVSTTGNQPAGEFQAGCADFQTAISSLPPGNYFADARLLGPSGEARTTTIAVAPFSVQATDLIIDVDFPASSFF